MHLPQHERRSFILDWKELTAGQIQAPCFDDSQDGCERAIHITDNGFWSMFGVAIWASSRCGSRWPNTDFPDELYKVITFELSNFRHSSEGRLEQVFERRCCCTLFLKVKQCGTILAPETPLFGEPGEGEYANCGRIPRWACKEIIPIPDEKQILAIYMYDDWGNKHCFMSLPPNASNDLCGNEPPSFVVSASCTYGCGAMPWVGVMEEIAMQLVFDYKFELRDFDPLMIKDPDGIVENRLCLELCGSCYTMFDPCNTCDNTTGECLAPFCPDDLPSNIDTIYDGMQCVNFGCQGGADGGCFGPLFGPWCVECFSTGVSYTGEEVALDDHLYHTQRCGSNHPGMIWTYSQYSNACHNCGWTMAHKCSQCVRLHIDAPDPFCEQMYPTSAGPSGAVQHFIGKTVSADGDGGIIHGMACYEASGFTPKAPQVNVNMLRLSITATTSCWTIPDTDLWHNGMCLDPPPLGAEPTIDTRNIKESFQKSFSPESVEVEIDLLNLIDLIDKTIVVSFGLPRPYSLEVGFDDGKTGLTNPTVYYLLPHPEMREIAEDIALGMIAMDGVPAVRKAIYLKEYSDENGDVFSMWISFTDLYASTLIESKTRLFHTSYQVFSYCNCKTKNCSCDVPSKPIGSRVSISFELRSEDEQELRSKNEQGYTKI